MSKIVERIESIILHGWSQIEIGAKTSEDIARDVIAAMRGAEQMSKERPEIVWCDERHVDMSRETLMDFVEMLNWHIGEIQPLLTDEQLKSIGMSRERASP